MLLTLPIPVLEIYGRQPAGQQRVWPDRTFEASPPFSCMGPGQIVLRDVFKKVGPIDSCNHFWQKKFDSGNQNGVKMASETQKTHRTADDIIKMIFSQFFQDGGRLAGNLNPKNKMADSVYSMDVMVLYLV